MRLRSLPWSLVLPALAACASDAADALSFDDYLAQLDHAPCTSALACHDFPDMATCLARSSATTSTTPNFEPT